MKNKGYKVECADGCGRELDDADPNCKVCYAGICWYCKTEHERECQSIDDLQFTMYDQLDTTVPQPLLEPGGEA